MAGGPTDEDEGRLPVEGVRFQVSGFRTRIIVVVLIVVHVVLVPRCLLGNLDPASFDLKDTEFPELPSGHIVVRGRLSGPGEYGHGACASRILQVEQIIELTRTSSGDTKAPVDAEPAAPGNAG